MNFLVCLGLSVLQMSQMMKRKLGRWWKKNMNWGWLILGCRWGVFQHWQNRRCRSCCMRYSSLLDIVQLSIHFMVLCLSLTLVTEPIFLFFRVWICWGGWACYGRRCSGWKLRGCEKLNWQWQDQRWRVGTDSWGEPYLIPPYPLSHPPPKYHHAPPTTISKPPPQEPERAAPEVSTPVVEEVELSSEAPSSTVSQVLPT